MRISEDMNSLLITPHSTSPSVSPDPFRGNPWIFQNDMWTRQPKKIRKKRGQPEKVTPPPVPVYATNLFELLGIEAPLPPPPPPPAVKPPRPTWTPLPWGIKKGCNLPWLMFDDPDYFYFLWERGSFKNCGEPLKSEAARIYFKSRSIRIPPGRYGIYIFKNGKFDKFCSGDRPPFDKTGPEYEIQAPGYLDMKVPRQRQKRDFKGNAAFREGLKVAFFQDSWARMPWDRRENFFNDDSIFHDNGPAIVTNPAETPKLPAEAVRAHS